MKKFYIILLIVIASIAKQSQAQPTITTFTPTSGPVGTAVTITGTNFNTTPANNIVFFGATKATVNTATSTSLSVTVPVGSTYQYISVTDFTIGLTAYSEKPFIVTFGCGGAINASSFAPKIDSSAGTYPNGVAIGDLDGDGKPDIVVANVISNTVSVLKNTSASGNISFAPKMNFAVGNSPYISAIGDLDGDGKPDLAITNGSDNSVSVLRNTSTIGTISFAAKVDFTTGSNPVCIAISDLEGDGKLDLAVTNLYDNDISIFKNTSTIGSISFAPKSDFTTGNYPRSIAIGDIDGDAKPDLVVSNNGSNTLSILRNSSTGGTISFALKSDFTIGNPFSIAIGDLDGDGKPDVAVVNDDTVVSGSVLRNTSTIGTISFAAKVDYATGLSRGLAIGDLDGDGKIDLAVTNYYHNTVSIFKNTSTSGSISFATKLVYVTGAASINVAIGDLNGDGKSDLAVANQSSNSVSMFKYEGLPIAPPICMVSVDSVSNYNLVFWDKMSYTNVDSFIVYREIVSNIYKRIGAVSMNSLSMMVDTVRQLYFPYTGDPNVGTYRYKLKIRDTCGNYSALGPYHNTIFVTQTGGTFNWNDYQIEGQTTPIPQLSAYQLFRDNLGNGNWTLIGGVSGSQLTINDPNFATYPNARWRIETQWSIVCTPTRSSVISTRSNIKGHGVGISNLNESIVAIAVSPNPYLENTTISYVLNKKSDVNIEVYNTIGQKVETLVSTVQTSGEYKYNFSAKQKGNDAGIYFVKITIDGNVTMKRIVEM